MDHGLDPGDGVIAVDLDLELAAAHGVQCQVKGSLRLRLLAGRRAGSTVLRHDKSF